MFNHLLRKTSGRPTGTANAKVFTLPAPIGGWNARDSLSAMKPEDAITLDNVIPDHGRVRLRDGYVIYATGVAGDYVETLMEYAPPGGTNMLFAASPSAVYDVTEAGPGVEAFDSMTNGRWQHLMMAALGGHYLCMVNGADGYHVYDGSVWDDKTADITSADAEFTSAADFVHIALHANRLWFVEKDSLKAWYLPVASIQGAVKQFPLGPLCKLGGSLLAIATWTRDAGDGMDDMLVFITTKGEVVVYQGTDPDTAATWQLVGVFRISEPLGRRCVIKVGGDLGLVTATGVSLMSKMIGLNLSGHKAGAITNKITRAFTDVYLTSGNNFGWQIQEFPSRGLIFVNVPVVERDTSYQFVMNTATGNWCRFTAIDALSWSLKGNKLFFGGKDGNVYEYGTETSDNGAPIEWLLQTAYNTCGGNNHKIFRMARALLITAPGYVPGIALSFNYDTDQPLPSFETAESQGSKWDVSPWDTSPWGQSVEESSIWGSVDGYGRAVSVAMAGSSKGVPFEFNQIDLMLEDASWL